MVDPLPGKEAFPEGVFHFHHLGDQVRPVENCLWRASPGENEFNVVRFQIEQGEHLLQRDHPSNGTEISEVVLVRLDGKSASHLPKSVTKRNGVGSFYSAWEVREDGVFATRKLSISPNLLRASRVRQLRALCQAWKDSGEQSVVVE